MLRLIPVILISLLAYSSLAQALQFSANAVMSTPGRADISTQLYYASGRMRKEFYYYGEPVIQILNTDKQINLMCFTEQQLCYQNKTLERINIGIESAINSPCEESASVKCENLGEQQLNNRKATQWKITTSEKDNQVVTHLWLDSELKIPVKQSLSNGATIELIWLGSEKLDNRDTEKWVQTIKLPNGESQKSFQWFDKELRISIRQSFPNGNTQELKHIVVENLPDNLFTMPLGYEKKPSNNQSGQASKKK
jgi:hypothetical protein